MWKAVCNPETVGILAVHSSLPISTALASLVAISFVSYKCNIWEMKAVINAWLLSWRVPSVRSELLRFRDGGFHHVKG